MDKSTNNPRKHKVEESILRIHRDEPEQEFPIMVNSVLAALPNSIMGMTQKMILSLVYRIWTDNEGVCLSTGEYIGSKLGLSAQAVNAQLTKLKDKKWLTWPVPKKYQSREGSIYMVRKIRVSSKTQNMMSLPDIRSYIPTIVDSSTSSSSKIVKKSKKPQWGYRA
jgi:hypothetical protein